MKTMVTNIWNVVMEHEHNPLKTYRRHTGSTYGFTNPCMDVVRDFALSTGSITVFGVSAVAHSLLIAGVVGTVAPRLRERSPTGLSVLDEG